MNTTRKGAVGRVHPQALRNCAALSCKKLKYLKTARMMRFSVMSAVISKLRVRAPAVRTSSHDVL